MNSNNTLLELEELKSELIRKVESIDITIEMLKTVSSLTANSNSKPAVKRLPSDINEYDKSWAIKNKAAFALKKLNQFVNIRGIAEVLNRYEPTIKIEDFITKLYTAVASLRSDGTIIKVQVGTSNVNSFWGSKNWLDNNGEIKLEHMYDQSQVKNFGGEKIEI